jgi:hypothetical protein
MKTKSPVTGAEFWLLYHCFDSIVKRLELSWSP